MNVGALVRRLSPKPRHAVWGAVLAVAACLGAMEARAIEMPDGYTKLWNDPEFVKKIDGNIEKYRKGDAEITVVGQDGKPLADATLEVEQKTHEFLFGCNLFVLGQLKTPELNQKYADAFAHLFNFATVPFYWLDLEPEKGKPRFAEDSAFIWRRPPPDQLVKWCKEHNITPKGHVLMYAKIMFMPKWLDANDPEGLRAAGLKHMTEIAERYRDDIPIWDCVNEEISRLGGPSEWFKVPEGYLAWCFKTADGLFPKSTRLMINEGTATKQYEAEVQGLKDQGVRVDGIGVQSHIYNLPGIVSGKVAQPKPHFDALNSMGRLGLPLYITEITIPSTGKNGPEYQAVILANLYKLWFGTPAMAGATYWNLGDGTAYKNENKAMGGLLDEQMNPKPAYKALDRLINHEWKTNLTVKTDAQGRARFRGFHGKYSLRLVSGGPKGEFPLELKSGVETTRTKLTAVEN